MAEHQLSKIQTATLKLLAATHCLAREPYHRWPAFLKSEKPPSDLEDFENDFLDLRATAVRLWNVLANPPLDVTTSQIGWEMLPPSPLKTKPPSIPPHGKVRSAHRTKHRFNDDTISEVNPTSKSPTSKEIVTDAVPAVSSETFAQPNSEMFDEILSDALHSLRSAASKECIYDASDCIDDCWTGFDRVKSHVMSFRFNPKIFTVQ